tara:strand:+ start:2675 stop:3052 length:378 start_codon:yes stop_codon:yes gene_type:complete
MNKKKNIIFVYNAKGGKWNYIIDTAHKYVSPSTYECNLCQITYDLKMKKPWRKYVENSPHDLKFLHEEELDQYGLSQYKDQLPICLERIDDKKYEILITKEEMNHFKDEFDLINSLDRKLNTHNT